MRHHAENGAFPVADSRYVMEGAVWIYGVTSSCGCTFLVAVSENYHVFVVEFFEKFCFFFFGQQESSFAVCDGHAEDFSFRNFAGEDAVAAVFVFKVDPAALVALNVWGERSFRVLADSFEARQQAFFNQNLEAVAYAQYRSAFVNERFQFFAQLRHQQSCPDYSGTYVVAVGKTAWKNQNVIIHEVSALYHFVQMQRFGLDA